MSDIIEWIKTKDEPEVTIRVLKIETLNPEYSNRTLVFVLGWLNEIELMRPLMSEISQYCNVLLYEPRGYGQSKFPKTKGLFTKEEYCDEIAKVLEYCNVKDNAFLLFGNCSGAALAFEYFLSDNKIKPCALTMISPQLKYKTPFWLPILGKLPNIFLASFQWFILLFLNIYLKFKKPDEVKTIIYAKEQLTKHGWSQRRFVLEFITRYDIRKRVAKITPPLMVFVGKDDYFIDLTQSKIFMSNPLSKVVELVAVGHRIHAGNEKNIAKNINTFFIEIEK